MGGCTAVWIAAVAWIGLLAGGPLSARWGFPLAAVALGLAWLARRAPDRVGTLALAVAVSAAAVARGLASHAVLETASSGLVSDGAPVWLTLRVDDHPTREGEAWALLDVVRGVRGLPRQARVGLRLPPGCGAEWGDTIRALARVEAPAAARVPGVASARDLAWAQGVIGQGRALWAEGGSVPTLQRATVTRWRRAIEARFARELSPETREIVEPLVIGDRSGLDPDLGALFRASGLVHLLALSGLHVVWIASVARGVAAACGGGPRLRASAGAACALFYMGIAGPLPSLARAAAQELIAAVARLRGRALDPLQALALSALGLLILEPTWAADLGFQLSCAATLGLATLGRRATEALERWPRALRLGLGPIVSTVAAQVTALPIVLDRFHALPWTALGSNLLAVPTCDLLLASAWLGAGLDALLPGAGHACFAACEPLSRALRAIASTAATAPHASWATGHSPWPVALAWCGVALTVLATLGPRDLNHARRPPSLAACTVAWLAPLAIALALLLGITAPPLAPPPGRWWLVVLDVGQGDALAIGGERGWSLVDAGPRSPARDAGSSAVVPFLQWAAVRRLDTMLLTHDHGDHTGGAAAVRRALPVSRWWVGIASPRPRVAPREAAAARAGDTLARFPTWVVRWPVSGFASRDPNAGSLALEVGEGAGRALLAADVDSITESRLALAGRFAALKVAHHGAATSSGAVFLARLSPTVAVISCGRHNPFGHPSPGALERLARCGARVRRTDRDGTVWLELGPQGVREIDWSRGDRALRPAFATRIETRGALADAPARW